MRKIKAARRRAQVTNSILVITVILLISLRSISSAAVILYCTKEKWRKEEEEENPTCYVSHKEDLSQGDNNMWNTSLGCFLFELFRLNLSVVSEGRLCGSGRESFSEKWARWTLSHIATGSCMTSAAIHCLCTVLCFVTHSHGCMKQCFFPDECSHRCLVLK